MWLRGSHALRDVYRPRTERRVACIGHGAHPSHGAFFFWKDISIIAKITQILANSGWYCSPSSFLSSRWGSVKVVLLMNRFSQDSPWSKAFYYKIFDFSFVRSHNNWCLIKPITLFTSQEPSSLCRTFDFMENTVSGRYLVYFHIIFHDFSSTVYLSQQRVLRYL